MSRRTCRKTPRPSARIGNKPCQFHSSSTTFITGLSTPHNKDFNRWWRKAPQEGLCLIPVSGVIVTGLKARGGRANS